MWGTFNMLPPFGKSAVTCPPCPHWIGVPRAHVFISYLPPSLFLSVIVVHYSFFFSSLFLLASQLCRLNWKKKKKSVAETEIFNPLYASTLRFQCRAKFRLVRVMMISLICSHFWEKVGIPLICHHNPAFQTFLILILHALPLIPFWFSSLSQK